MSSILLELVRPGPPQPPPQLSPGQLAALKPVVLNSNLLMLLYSRLSEYRANDPAGEAASGILRYFEPLYMRGIAYSIRQEAVEKEIASLLEEHGIRAIVIRGNEIARDIYNNPNCRTSSDIDVLIKRVDAVRADAVMSQAGHKQDFREPILFNLSRIHHASYSHGPSGIPVELHWNFGVPYFFHLTSEEIWEEVLYDGSGNGKLSPGMVMIMLLIHHHSHSFRELRILLDIVWALHKYEKEIDWEHFAGRLEQIGLLKTARITLFQIKSLWKGGMADMKSFFALEQALCRTGCNPGFLARYFKPDIGRNYRSRIYRDKFIARFALDGWTTTILSFFRTLLPAPEAIRELYGVRETRMMPLLYLRFIAWRIRCWTGL